MSLCHVYAQPSWTRQCLTRRTRGQQHMTPPSRSSKHAQDATPARNATHWSKDSAVNEAPALQYHKTSTRSRHILTSQNKKHSTRISTQCRCMEEHCTDQNSIQRKDKPSAHATSLPLAKDALSTQSGRHSAGPEHGAVIVPRIMNGSSKTMPWITRIKQLYANGDSTTAIGG